MADGPISVPEDGQRAEMWDTAWVVTHIAGRKDTVPYFLTVLWNIQWYHLQISVSTGLEFSQTFPVTKRKRRVIASLKLCKVDKKIIEIELNYSNF